MMEQANGAIRLIVEDNGCGFDVNRVTRSPEVGLGLFGMQERASLLGGSLRIDSQHQEGTKITVEIPITNAAEET